MGLLDFDPKTRRVWMFPRNIRDIAPWKLYRILKILLQCDDIDQYSGEDQKMMYRLLEESGIKKKGEIRDRNPGGMRTYYSQLETLGFVFRPDNGKTYHFTLAGEAMSEEENPLQILQYQLLRHQYPSAYGLGQNVKMDPRMKIKPFVFLLRLLHDERLDFKLSNFDVVFPVIYGHNDDCYEFVVKKILEFRELGVFEDVISNCEIDLFTPRSSPSGNPIGNIKDIANTAMNYLKAAALILEAGKEKGRTFYSFNDHYEHFYKEMENESDYYIPIRSKSDYQSFQRNYGRYLKSKDTRTTTDSEPRKESPSLQFATFKYVEFLNEELYSDDTALFVSEMAKYGISQKDAVYATEKFKDKKDNLQDNTYLEYAYSGGKQASEFEKATTELLKSLGFSESQWIGRRKSFNNWRGNFPDVYIKQPGTQECGMADTKATSSYSLGHDDMLKLRETYIHTNLEIDPKSRLEYFVYIVGGVKGNISQSLSMLSAATGLPVSALDARGMLKIKRKNWSPSFIEEHLFKAGAYISADEIELM